MEDTFRMLADGAALVLESIVVLLVCIGAGDSLLHIGRYFVEHGVARPARRLIWMRFARWLTLALEFALGADIIRTAIAPSWTEIGQLAVIAAVRTLLGLFLERDIETFDLPAPRSK